MIRLIVLLFLLLSAGFSCTICVTSSPKTKVQIYIDSTKQTINTAKFIWKVNKEFTDSLKEVYDTNADGIIDKKELLLVEDSFLNYAEQNNFSTHISYDVIVDKNKSRKIDPTSTNTYIIDSVLHFEYTLKLNYEIKKDYSLYIQVLDQKRFFLITLDRNAIYFKNENSVQKLINKQSVIFHISTVPIEKAKTIVLKKEIQTPSIKEKTLLEKFVKKVKENLIAIKNGADIWALLSLLLVSFVYGVIHAIGPGHGKTLAFSYFLSHKSSFLKAFFISQASAFIHILGAFVLVLISVFVLKTFLNNFVSDSVLILTKVSALMIILLACYIFYKKIKNKSCECCHPDSKVNWQTTTPINQKLKPQTTEKKSQKQDIYFVLTAGLIPCPGTVVLFIYAFILDTYFAVVLASIFISLGMGLVIFISAFLGVGIRNQGQKSKRFITVLEYTSLIVMFSLGVFLYLNANLI